jgi:hypothetical protein
MTSKRSQEGYLLIDNRGGPGFSDQIGQAANLPPGAGRGQFEAPTYTCSHCQTVVVLNPMRNRERAYCPKCDHYICDTCGTIRALNGGQCKTFRQVIEEVQEAADVGHTPAIWTPGHP